MDVTAWLLESDPAIRWRVLRDLEGAPPERVEAERARTPVEGWGAELLALQDGNGQWGGAEWTDDHRSTYWAVATLRWLGVPPDDAAVVRALDRVQGNVVWHYWDNLPFFHGEVEPCINGTVLASGAYFGRLGGGAGDRLVPRLLGERQADGGWNCDAPGSERSSFDSTLCVLEGLLAYQRAGGEHPGVQEARAAGEEYLLERRLMRRLSTGEEVQPRYRNLSYPPYWFYDVLRALDYFRAAGRAFEPRMREALDAVAAQRGDDGRWPAGVPWPGNAFLDLDAPEGEPSRWSTLRALRVMRWAGADAA